ncbi:FHA domain-containing serine/threonine-protein kinase [Chamaesiphon minutus]|uniref:Protein kinase domain with FHA domain n=1 Tax=Chamaesiphon minutus (strain ATCC 27169 / PCC 6605) TaxID=1173020 RepID=K9UQT8_CHAP6|nr:FHA domain-containing serine/threonine-protein kinase [Chamaesiphon minutus]AFY96614.1 protein kinase domain with FHA domain [Chamaesiphon minutus PCC 6605]
MKNIQISLWDEQRTLILQQWQFTPPAPIEIGRSPERQVVIDRPSISRLHATISYTSLRQGGGYWEISNHSPNGTFVNQIAIVQGKGSTLITNDARIELSKGGTLLTVELDVAPLQVRVPAAPVKCEHSDNPPNTLFCIHCGEPITVIRQIKQYQVLKTLGQGGMGTTYLAWDKAKLLVLKEMNADMAVIPKAQELFEREAKILQSLHHPGIPEYYDFFVADGRKYLAMELIHGQDLDLYVMERGKVNIAQAIDWMIQLCEILGYIHQQQPPLIHRDVKPANILVRTIDRRIFLLDFGAVKEIGTLGGTKIGAPDYMAPEQNNGKPVTQSDLFAIGPTLIFLLTGRNPADFIQILPDGYRFDLSNVPLVSPQMQATIDKVTQRRPIDRYQTAAELAQDLRKLARPLN